jgi:hypothetical protein
MAVQKTPWANAVGRIAKATPFTEVTLADEAGLYPMKLRRCLSGTYSRGKKTFPYRPDSRDVRAINHAAAALARIPRARTYLNVLAISAGVMKQEGGDFDVDPAFALLGSFDDYFTDGAPSAVAAAFEHAGLDAGRQAALFVALTASIGGELVLQLEGRPNNPPFEVILKVFRRRGAPLDPYVKQDAETAIRRARDTFAYSADIEIARLPAERSDRVEVLGKVLAHFDFAFQRITGAIEAENSIAELWASAQASATESKVRKRPRKGTRR